MTNNPGIPGLGTLSRRRFGLGLAGVLAGAVLAGVYPALAHAMLSTAEPRVGASVRAVPDRVALVFTESVEPAFSLIRVTDAAGTRVDRDDLRRDPAQATRLIVGLNKLSPGVYRVEWKVTSSDTHKTEGSYTFTVVVPAPATPGGS